LASVGLLPDGDPRRGLRPGGNRSTGGAKRHAAEDRVASWAHPRGKVLAQFTVLDLDSCKRLILCSLHKHSLLNWFTTLPLSASIMLDIFRRLRRLEAEIMLWEERIMILHIQSVYAGTAVGKHLRSDGSHPVHGAPGWMPFQPAAAPRYVAANAETLRHRLVRHEGRRELVAAITGWSPAEFELGIARFLAQIREATDPVLHENPGLRFSTTTPAIRTASEVALMDTFSA
jgi:hypothetical protein